MRNSGQKGEVLRGDSCQGSTQLDFLITSLSMTFQWSWESGELTGSWQILTQSHFHAW